MNDRNAVWILTLKALLLFITLLAFTSIGIKAFEVLILSKASILENLCIQILFGIVVLLCFSNISTHIFPILEMTLRITISPEITEGFCLTSRSKSAYN